ncbi:hypothetical protein DL767_002771 [Monosporascus sp. MG133]|nr:hypothetical protein DL767_002771 [Monosporascus sp. MG133]
MSPLNPKNYTVAWIAPLEIEARAALHMLDERHQGRFAVSRGDDYVFHAGSMCGHNIIIATLPAGQAYGTGSAAALASQVKRFFPNLWFGLLVGVAAGLPDLSRTPPRDIRLGDVLVGLPEGESAGLIAYDLGKETEDGFQPLRFGHVLAATEPIVRAAIGSIKLEAPNETGRFLPYYESIRDKEHATGTFADPGQEQDKLYWATGNEAETLVHRERRPESRRTRVWYGPIGSGEKLLKNAQKRNELRDIYGVIGLEMEAAGTMNCIPVGVIRGVCDYGDRHKNKEWQPYAAAMAAAYTKAVLYEITPATREAQVPRDGPAESKDSPQQSQACRVIHFPRNDDFVQRSAFSEQIEKLLPQSTEYQSAALWGLGGSGKTQLALDYAYRRCSDRTCSVFWVHADSETSFAQDYKWIAGKLGLADALEGEKLLSAVRKQIETLPQWVLVLDNADDLALFGVGRGPSTAELGPDLSDYIPRGTVGTVLWTSRDQRIAGSLVGRRRGIHVARMTNSEGEMLLKAIRDLEAEEDEVNDIPRLLAELEWLPLAISQAATYMRRTRLSIAEYLGKIQEKKKRWKVLRKSEHDRHRRPQASNSVLETWNISVEYIRQESEMAYDILNVLAFVDNQNIPFQMIAEAAQIISRGRSIGYRETSEREGSGDNSGHSAMDNSSSSASDWEDEESEEEIVDVVTRLEEFSFLTPRILEGGGRGRAYDMHKLVQEAISYNLHIRKDKHLEEVRSATIAFQVTDKLFPDEWERETWEKCEDHLIHAQRAGEWAGLHGGEVAVSGLLSRVSDYLYDRGRWREKEPVDLIALGLLRKALGERDPGTIRGMVVLTATYYAQGRYNEAEKIYTEMLQLRREMLGEKHPDTIKNMGHLATTYHAQGRYNEAEKIHTEVLQLRREMLGEKHPDTIKSMAELALTYHVQGRYNEAEKIHTEVLQLRHEMVGEKHPDTIKSMEYLAVTYHAQGRYNEAEKIYTEVLQLQREMLGKKHPDTIRNMASLATTYYTQGRYNEAEKIHTEVLQLRHKILGKKHPDTLSSMASLVTTYYAQGRYNEAEKINTEVLQLRREILGEKHPDTLWSMASLATTYYAQGRYNEAEKINTEVLQLRREVLGKKHPYTIESMKDLAETYRAQDRLEEAEEIDLAVAKLSAVARDDDDPPVRALQLRDLRIQLGEIRVERPVVLLDRPVPDEPEVVQGAAHGVPGLRRHLREERAFQYCRARTAVLLVDVVSYFGPAGRTPLRE